MESNISRDHIALEAMKALLSKSVEVKDSDNWRMPDPVEIAKTAYEYADAMVAVREKGGSHG